MGGFMVCLKRNLGAIVCGVESCDISFWSLVMNEFRGTEIKRRKIKATCGVVFGFVFCVLGGVFLIW